MSPISARRERISVIQSLSAGSIPSVGLRALQVGRVRELQAIVDDLERAKEGLSTVRFIAGPPESGKSFLMNLARTVAVEKGFLAARADLSPDRCLYADSGEARAFYRELMTNIFIADSAESITIGRLLQDWIAPIEQKVKDRDGSTQEVTAEIVRALQPLHELTHGFDFATALQRYYEGYIAGHDALQENALRWLRAEYTSKSEANQDLGVRTIIGDGSIREALNLFAAFTRIVGFKGLLIVADELTKITRRVKDTNLRNNNYDVIVELLDDCLKARIRGLVVLFGVEDGCVQDRLRGLYSNEVLARWLAPNRFAMNGHKDFSTPVILLESLKIADFPQLLHNVQSVFGHDEMDPSLSEEDIEHYVSACVDRMGETYFDIPRTVIKDFVGLLRILHQDPTVNWRDLIRNSGLSVDTALKPASQMGMRDGLYQTAGWYDQETDFGRSRWSPGKIALAVILPLFVIAMVLISTAMFGDDEKGASADLQVKYSSVRSGLRLDLDSAAIPLRLGNYYSIAARFTAPRYAYLATIEADGHVDVQSFENEDGLPIRLENVQFPGADRMLPLVAPAGTKTVVLLASPNAHEDPDQLKARLRSLENRPRVHYSEMIVLKDGVVSVQPNQTLGNDPNKFAASAGFLENLQQLFGSRFDVIEAVAFPVLDQGSTSGMTLYDLNKP